MTADGAPHRPASLDEQIARVGTADVVVAFLTYNNADTLPAVMATDSPARMHPPIRTRSSSPRTASGTSTTAGASTCCRTRTMRG